MNLSDWFPAISTTSLFAAALWLMRSMISSRLRSSVQHEFNQKLENVKADLRSKETQIESLRSGALSGLVSRQIALTARRVEAVDQLWSAVQKLSPAKSVSQILGVLKFDGAVKVAAENERAREMFTALGGTKDISEFMTDEAEKARPFVSEMAWAIFSAYRAILFAGLIKMQILKSGIGIPDLVDEEKINKLITAVLPCHQDYLKKYGSEGYHLLLDRLEPLLLAELKNVLEGVEADKSAVRQAGEILREAESIMSSIQEPKDAK